MSDLVPADEIEQIVGTKRDKWMHYGRAVSAEQVVYILHSQHCKDTGIDLRACVLSRALDRGIDLADWEGCEDRPVALDTTADGRLVPRWGGDAYAKGARDAYDVVETRLRAVLGEGDERGGR